MKLKEGYTKVSEGVITKIVNGERLTNLKCRHCGEWHEEQYLPLDQKEIGWSCEFCRRPQECGVISKEGDIRVFETIRSQSESKMKGGEKMTSEKERIERVAEIMEELERLGFDTYASHDGIKSTNQKMEIVDKTVGLVGNSVKEKPSSTGLVIEKADSGVGFEIGLKSYDGYEPNGKKLLRLTRN